MAPPRTLDPGDCHRPACDDISNMMQLAAAASASASSSNRSDTAVSTVRSKNAKESTTDPLVAAPPAHDICPPGSAELGRSSWNLLHSMAAWYPDSPSDTDQQNMQWFVGALARFYPCTWCARDFARSIAQDPVRTETRQDLCLWMCEQHNLVNDKTGKPLFECDMTALDARWRQSAKDECQSSSLH